MCVARAVPKGSLAYNSGIWDTVFSHITAYAHRYTSSLYLNCTPREPSIDYYQTFPQLYSALREHFPLHEVIQSENY